MWKCLLKWWQALHVLHQWKAGRYQTSKVNSPISGRIGFHSTFFSARIHAILDLIVPLKPKKMAAPMTLEDHHQWLLATCRQFLTCLVELETSFEITEQAWKGQTQQVRCPRLPTRISVLCAVRPCIAKFFAIPSSRDLWGFLWVQSFSIVFLKRTDT